MKQRPYAVAEDGVAAAGNVNWKVAPRSVLALAHNRPSWEAMIRRLIDNPMPVPSGLVVKNASKMRAAWSFESPIPVSLTEINN